MEHVNMAQEPADLTKSAATEISYRERSMLRAVADGRAQMMAGCGCDLTIDGAWCDHLAAQHLVGSGLIRPVGSSAVGQMVPVEITSTGRHLLGISVDSPAMVG
jgi:hypothetical protein